MCNFIKQLNNAPFCEYQPHNNCLPFWCDYFGRVRSAFTDTPANFNGHQLANFKGDRYE